MRQLSRHATQTEMVRLQRLRITNNSRSGLSRLGSSFSGQRESSSQTYQNCGGISHDQAEFFIRNTGYDQSRTRIYDGRLSYG
jgi:hypothetical protein